MVTIAVGAPSPSLNNPTSQAAPAAGEAAPTSTSVAALQLGSVTAPYLSAAPAQATARSHNRRPRAGPAFRGCSGGGLTYAQPQSRINVSTVWSQFDSDLTASFQGLQAPSVGTLRIVAVGTAGEEIHAYSDASGSALISECGGECGV
jgi:hypothetical protein